MIALGRGYASSTTPQQIALWLNLLGALRVVFICAFAARTEWVKHVQRIYIATAAFAFAYVCAYIVLVFGPFVRGDWSASVSLLGPAVWWFVWPAWAKYRAKHRETNRRRGASELVDIILPSGDDE